MPNETGGPWVMGEPTTQRAEHKCVDGGTKYFRADKCVTCLTARLAEASETETRLWVTLAKEAERSVGLEQRLAAAEARERSCTWTIIDCSKAETSCGHVRSINAFRSDFCSFCGGKVIEVAAKGGRDDE